MVFRWQSSAAARIGIGATFASAAIGLLLAAFQVQGWKMPKPLAVTLIVLLIVMIVAALGVIGYEVVKAFQRFLEHRATSASWVSSEKPGLLDYEADGIRANERFAQELSKHSEDTEKLGKRLNKHTRRMAKAAAKSGKKKQRLANRSAKDIDRSAVFIEKRLELLDAIVKDIKRNTEGLIALYDLVSPEDIATAKGFSAVLKSNHEASAEAIKSVDEYYQTVKGIEQQNTARTVRLASGRLANSLDGMRKTLRKSESGSLAVTQLLDRKIEKAEKGTQAVSLPAVRFKRMRGSAASLPHS